MIFIMLGAPGAGKGTQAAILSTNFNIPHISTGEIFRMHMKNETKLGIKVREFMDQGSLVPDELVLDIVKDRMQQEDCESGFILDGFPRTMTQATAFTDALVELNKKVDYVVNVNVPDENIIRRMAGRRVCPNCGATYHIEYCKPVKEGVCDKCGTDLIQREDDQEETVKKRLAIYHKQTQPLINYYNGAGLLLTVDGTKDVEEVTNNIMKALN